MIQSRLNKHVHWVPSGATGPENNSMHQGWYFDCEDYALMGPYLSEQNAIKGLDKYLVELNPPVIDFDGRGDET